MTAEAAPGPAPRRRARLLFLAPVLVFAGLAILLLARLFSGADPSTIPSALIGKHVPSFALPPVEGLTRDGKPVPGLTGLDLDGKVTVVHVWASWCVPCRDEHPILLGLASDPQLNLVGINYKDDPDNARRFLGTFGDPYRAVGADRNGRVAIDWGVYGVPETFVVGPDGKIVLKHVGPLTQEAVETELKPAIKAAATPHAG